MVDRQKPTHDLASRAGRALQNPGSASKKTIRELAGRVLADERNAPQQHRRPRRGR